MIHSRAGKVVASGLYPPCGVVCAGNADTPNYAYAREGIPMMDGDGLK